MGKGGKGGRVNGGGKNRGVIRVKGRNKGKVKGGGKRGKG